MRFWKEAGHVIFREGTTQVPATLRAAADQDADPDAGVRVVPDSGGGDRVENVDPRATADNPRPGERQYLALLIPGGRPADIVGDEVLARFERDVDQPGHAESAQR